MKRGLKIGSWVVFTVLVFAGLYSAANRQSDTTTELPEIFIQVDGDNAFLNPTEVKGRLSRSNLIYPGQKMDKLDVAAIEKHLESMSEIRSCKVYKNLGNKWQIDIEVRRPIARIFNNNGESFYLDDLGFPMTTSPLYTARVVVVSGDIPDKKDSKSVEEIINNHTLKTKFFLDDIYRISKYVCNDPLLSAQIGQIHREKNGDFVLIPQVGEHLIVFGSAFSDKEVAEKFEKLKVFYKEGLPFEGWNKYKEINLKFKKQVVCKKVKEEEL